MFTPARARDRSNLHDESLFKDLYWVFFSFILFSSCNRPKDNKGPDTAVFLHAPHARQLGMRKDLPQAVVGMPGSDVSVG